MADLLAAGHVPLVHLTAASDEQLFAVARLQKGLGRRGVGEGPDFFEFFAGGEIIKPHWPALVAGRQQQLGVGQEREVYDTGSGRHFNALHLRGTCHVERAQPGVGFGVPLFQDNDLAAIAAKLSVAESAVLFRGEFVPLARDRVNPHERWRLAFSAAAAANAAEAGLTADKEPPPVIGQGQRERVKLGTRS